MTTTRETIHPGAGAGAAAGAVLLCALLPISCSSEENEEVGPVKDSPAPAVSVIGLQQAVEQGLVTIRTSNNNSKREKLAISLEPKVDTQPWIRIEPGWRTVCQDSERESHHVTFKSHVFQLNAKNNTLEWVPHVQMKYSRFQSVPKDCSLERVEDEGVLALLELVDSKNKETLPWRVVQIAMWALVDDVGFEQVRKMEYGIRRGGAYDMVSMSGSSQLAPSVGVIDRAFDLLEEAGHSRLDFMLWEEANDYLDEHIAKYVDRHANGDRWAWSSFDKIKFFYPWERAADMLISAFERHREVGKETSFRRSAFEALARVMDERAVAALKLALEQEEDAKLRAKMQAALDKSATPR